MKWPFLSCSEEPATEITPLNFLQTYSLSIVIVPVTNQLTFNQITMIICLPLLLISSPLQCVQKVCLR